MKKSETFDQAVEEEENKIDQAEASNESSEDVAENIVNSVFKLSISTFLNIGIYLFLFLFANFFVTKEIQGEMNVFSSFTNTFMTIAILGLDQAFLRFYHKPPGKLTSNGLLRHCLYFSGSILLFIALLGSTVFLTPLYNFIKLSPNIGTWVVPILFLNAGFYMVARYINIYLRMEMRIFAYTLQGFLTQVFFKIFYLLGAFSSDPLIPMIIISTTGLGLFAVVQIIIYRKTLKPKSGGIDKEAYKTILPFGFFTAPSSIFVALNASVPLSLIKSRMIVGGAAIGALPFIDSDRVANSLNFQIENATKSAVGTYSIAFQLSNMVAMIQGGFSTFWTPYIYKNYKTHHKQITYMHDLMNFIILVFFCLLVAFEDIIFLILNNYSSAKFIFPLMMLSAVFNLLCVTTVNGNALKQRPIFDTIGIGLGLLIDVLGCIFLIPPFGILGATIALVLGNATAYVFRTVTAQILYPTIAKPSKTVLAFVIATVVAIFGTMYTNQFLIKFLVAAVGIVAYIFLYMPQFKRTWKLGIDILQKSWAKVTHSSSKKK